MALMDQHWLEEGGEGWLRGQKIAQLNCTVQEDNKLLTSRPLERGWCKKWQIKKSPRICQEQGNSCSGSSTERDLGITGDQEESEPTWWCCCWLCKCHAQICYLINLITGYRPGQECEVESWRRRSLRMTKGLENMAYEIMRPPRMFSKNEVLGRKL